MTEVLSLQLLPMAAVELTCSSSVSCDSKVSCQSTNSCDSGTSQLPQT